MVGAGAGDREREFMFNGYRVQFGEMRKVLGMGGGVDRTTS